MTMNFDDQIHHWFSSAQHDIDTAFVLAEEGRSYDCMRACWECVNKMLKGIWVLNRTEHPPQTANLLWLAKEQQIALRDKDLDLLIDLTTVHESTLWADDVKALRKEIKIDRAQATQEQTEELIQWLKENYFR